MDTKKVIKALDDALIQEHTCAIRYMTHAEMVTGHEAETVAARLKEIGGDEWRHAEQLRSRVTALGGMPSTGMLEVKMAKSIDDILDINIKEEVKAIKMYQNILKMIPKGTHVHLYETIETILEDEEEHLEELSRLRG